MSNTHHKSNNYERYILFFIWFLSVIYGGNYYYYCSQNKPKRRKETKSNGLNEAGTGKRRVDDWIAKKVHLIGTWMNLQNVTLIQPIDSRSGMLYKVWGLRSFFRFKKKTNSTNCIHKGDHWHFTRQSNTFSNEIFCCKTDFDSLHPNSRGAKLFKLVMIIILNWNFSFTKFPFQSNDNFTDFQIGFWLFVSYELRSLSFQNGASGYAWFALLAFIHLKRGLGVESMSNILFYPLVEGKMKIFR